MQRRVVRITRLNDEARFVEGLDDQFSGILGLLLRSPVFVIIPAINQNFDVSRPSSDESTVQMYLELRPQDRLGFSQDRRMRLYTAGNNRRNHGNDYQTDFLSKGKRLRLHGTVRDCLERL